MRRELATTTVQNVLTFDVEDWYQLTGRQLRGHGEARPDILARQLDRVIELLARHGSREHAWTFFVSTRPRRSAYGLLR